MTSSETERIEVFYIFAGQILGDLYATFPVRRVIRMDEHLKSSGLQYNHEIIIEIYISTRDWLERNQYIEVEHRPKSETWKNEIQVDILACLTDKGLSALNISIPDKLAPDLTAGEGLRKAVASAGQEAMRTALSEIMRRVFDAAFRLAY